MRKLDAKTKILRIRVSPRLLARLRQIAVSKNKTMSEIARFYIQNGVKEENVLR
jgi:hypothetical protein